MIGLANLTREKLKALVAQSPLAFILWLTAGLLPVALGTEADALAASMQLSHIIAIFAWLIYSASLVPAPDRRFEFGMFCVLLTGFCVLFALPEISLADAPGCLNFAVEFLTYSIVPALAGAVALRWPGRLHASHLSQSLLTGLIIAGAVALCFATLNFTLGVLHARLEDWLYLTFCIAFLFPLGFAYALQNPHRVEPCQAERILFILALIALSFTAFNAVLTLALKQTADVVIAVIIGGSALHWFASAGPCGDWKPMRLLRIGFLPLVTPLWLAFLWQKGFSSDTTDAHSLFTQALLAALMLHLLLLALKIHLKEGSTLLMVSIVCLVMSFASTPLSTRLNSARLERLMVQKGLVENGLPTTRCPTLSTQDYDSLHGLFSSLHYANALSILPKHWFSSPPVGHTYQTEEANWASFAPCLQQFQAQNSSRPSIPVPPPPKSYHFGDNMLAGVNYGLDAGGTLTVITLDMRQGQSSILPTAQGVGKISLAGSGLRIERPVAGSFILPLAPLLARYPQGAATPRLSEIVELPGELLLVGDLAGHESDKVMEVDHLRGTLLLAPWHYIVPPGK